MVTHIDIPPKLGLSLNDEGVATEWRALVTSINERLLEGGLNESVLFHGTSSRALEKIVDHGLEPTDISHAIADGDVHDVGSFWGDLMTAAAYAEDTATERHPGSRPVILAVSVADLEADCRILADGATFDFPLPGLTRLDDPAVYARWSAACCDLPWRESLTDLGAVVAVHQFSIPVEDLSVMNSPDDLEAVLRKQTASAPLPTP